MSKIEQAPIQQAIEVPQKTFTQKLLENAKKIRQIQIKPFIEDIITFVSIIAAYEFISMTYQKEKSIEKYTFLNFSNKKTQPAILLIFALYLISLKIIHIIAYKYDTAPPKPKIIQNLDGMEFLQQPQDQSTPIETPIPVVQKAISADSYTTLTQQLIQNSMYGLVFIICTTSYTYLGTFNKGEKPLVEVEQISFLIFWYVCANIFYAGGKLLGKLTGIKTLHHFGLALGVFVIAMEIGLGHGFNTFIFI